MSYLSTVLADAPQHYWRCADGAGQMAHDIGSSKTHLGSAGGMGYSGPSSNGGAVFCDGSVNKGIISAAGIHWGAPLSIELWLWPYGNTSAAGALCAWNNTANPSIAIFAQTNGTITFGISGSATLTSAAVSLQRWHHLVATWDGATMRLYIDGIAVSQAFVSAANNNPIVAFGQNAVGGSNGFNGLLAEVAYYASVLSPAQVNNHFLAAEQPLTVPVYNAPGTFDASGGTFTPDVATLDLVLQSVRKSYVAP